MNTLPALLAAVVAISMVPPSFAQFEWRSGIIRSNEVSFCMNDCGDYFLEADEENESDFIVQYIPDGWGLLRYRDLHVFVYGFQDICPPECVAFYAMHISVAPVIAPLVPIHELVLGHNGPSLGLHWTAPTMDINGYPVVDVEGYRVHGSRDPWFEPAEDNLLGTTTDTLWNLPWPGANDPRWFRVVALGQSRIDLP
jgi:hypothetical protein